ITLFVGRKLCRDVFQKDEGTELHQKFAEEQRRSSRLSTNHARGLCFGAPIVGRLYFCDGFENTVVLGEGTASGGAPFIAVSLHPSGFESEQGVEQVVCVSSEKRSGQANNPIRTRRQRAKSVALGRIARQLVNLVANRVVEPARHVASDEFNRRHAADLVRVRLHERAVHWTPAFAASDLDRLRDLDLLKLGQSEAAVVGDDRFARVGIDDAAHVWARARYAVRVPPEVAELRAFTAYDEK